MIRIAASQYQIEFLSDWQQYTLKVETLIQQAKQDNVELILLPEYAGIETAFTRFDNDFALFSHLSSQLERYIAFYKDLAQRYQMYIQPGTIVASDKEPQQFYNRAYFFGPQGGYHYQDKLQLVSGEREEPSLQQGNKQTLFKTTLGDIGIAVCYDSEFPEIVASLTRCGANLILVPSFTPGIQSFNRVFYSCRARAIENQCYVMMSCAIGTTQFSDTLFELDGQANIFSPIDNGFPEDGILSQGPLNQITTIASTISYDKLLHVRKHGQVRNFHDAKLTSNNLQNNVEEYSLL